MEFPHTFTDQMSQQITLDNTPRRIISLVPSQTELLHDLGLDEEVVGITKFCIHPEEWFRNKTRVGGTKQYHFDKIAALQPDLIIGNKEENDEEQIRELQKTYNVWMSDIHNLQEAMTMIGEISSMVNRKSKGEEIISRIDDEFTQMRKSIPSNRKRLAAYLIWRNPYMAAGQNTFINSMMNELNLENVLNHDRYPETTLEELKELNPELVLLSSEPYPFKEKHVEEILQAVPDAKIFLVDGEKFSWYGTRLLQAPAYFTKLLSEINHKS
jgi:ABC-type Fe3+-hydroxamate transport system substrate-binding protein